MIAEEIRALYVQALARSDYEAWRAAYNALDGDEPPAPEWDAPVPYPTRRNFLAAAQRQADALAAAGLLPTSAVDSLAGGCQLGVHDPFGDYPPTVQLRHYVTDPRPAEDTPEAWAAWQAIQDDWNRRVLGIAPEVTE